MSLLCTDASRWVGVHMAISPSTVLMGVHNENNAAAGRSLSWRPSPFICASEISFASIGIVSWVFIPVWRHAWLQANQGTWSLCSLFFFFLKVMEEKGCWGLSLYIFSTLASCGSLCASLLSVPQFPYQPSKANTIYSSGFEMTSSQWPLVIYTRGTSGSTQCVWLRKGT